jgi:hypothetical protein
MQHEYIKDLSQELRLHIEIDRTGWLHEWAQVHFILGTGRLIYPTTIRIGDDRQSGERLRTADIQGRCGRYNRALLQLRQLRKRCAAVVMQRHDESFTQARLLVAYQWLYNLEIEIDRRQARRMANNVVTLTTLDAETAYFEDRLLELEPTVARAEHPTHHPDCDVETLDSAVED